MNTALSESPATTCSWCGRKNQERAPFCSGCGTRLVAEPTAPEPLDVKGRSRMLAVSLTLIFGPLGLVYVRAWGTLLLMVILSAPFVLTHTGGLWVSIGVRIISAALAYSLVGEQDGKSSPSDEWSRLLQEAARLENTDRAKAVAAYEDIARRFPNTLASKEATRAIEVLKRAR